MRTVRSPSPHRMHPAPLSYALILACVDPSLLINGSSGTGMSTVFAFRVGLIVALATKALHAAASWLPSPDPQRFNCKVMLVWAEAFSEFIVLSIGLSPPETWASETSQS